MLKANESGTSLVMPFLLSGGSGSRLWPVSRKSYPKQFLNLCGESSMLQETAMRVSGKMGFGALTVICGNDQRFEVAAQLKAANLAGRIVLEPVGRNTALPGAIAALMAFADDPEAVVLLMPADHFIPNPEAFNDTVAAAAKVARSEKRIVTFGIDPTSPETGYGYIRHGSPLADSEQAFEVAAFVEKPDAATAQSYIDAGDHYWNSGIFVATAATLVEEFQSHAPATLDAAKSALADAASDLDFLRLSDEGVKRAPDISFDYAIMENTARAAVVKADFAWSDLGSWGSMWQIGEGDADENVRDGDVILEETSGSYVKSEGPLVATVGVDNLVVVATPDAVLVADRTKSEKVKTIVGELKRQKRSIATEHKKMHRPWGSYESLATGSRFQVKRIVVTPGSKLSLQSHHHRAEHWVVVSGTAVVTVGKNEKLLTENESIYIPLGDIHRLENPGKVDLVLIEVQSGAYLGEDDIVRYEDVYARV